MADFLSRLVARAQGTAPLARPVVAPLFARGPAMPADLTTDAEIPAEPTVAGDGRADAGAELPDRIPPARSRAAFSRPSREELDQRRAEPRPIPGTEGAESTGRPAERERAAAPRLEAQSEVEAPAPRRATTRRLPAATDGSATREPRAAAMPASPPPVPNALRERRGAAPRQAERDAPGQVVQISIGRIEVRAVTAPESRAAKPAPPRVDPRLSLEGYLKSGKPGR